MLSCRKWVCLNKLPPYRATSSSLKSTVNMFRWSPPSTFSAFLKATDPSERAARGEQVDIFRTGFQKKNMLHPETPRTLLTGTERSTPKRSFEGFILYTADGIRTSLQATSTKSDRKLCYVQPGCTFLHSPHIFKVKLKVALSATLL